MTDKVPTIKDGRDYELAVIEECLSLLTGLSIGGRFRVLNYLTDRVSPKIEPQRAELLKRREDDDPAP